MSVLHASELRQTDHVDDLYVPPGPGAPRGLKVPKEELIEQFSRASGPGGQGVNTTDSRVQLSFDLGTTTALSDVQRERVLDRLADSISGTMLTISASEHRSQRQNRTAARQRLTPARRRGSSFNTAINPANKRLNASTTRRKTQTLRDQAQPQAPGVRMTWSQQPPDLDHTPIGICGTSKEPRDRDLIKR